MFQSSGICCSADHCLCLAVHRLPAPKQHARSWIKRQENKHRPLRWRSACCPAQCRRRETEMYDVWRFRRWRCSAADRYHVDGALRRDAQIGRAVAARGAAIYPIVDGRTLHLGRPAIEIARATGIGADHLADLADFTADGARYFGLAHCRHATSPEVASLCRLKVANFSTARA